MSKPTDSAPSPRGGRGDDVVVEGVTVPTRRARLWAVVGALFAVTAIWFAPLGVVGMAAGAGAHLKGDRFGMPVAVVAAITTIIGMSLAFFV